MCCLDMMAEFLASNARALSVRHLKAGKSAFLLASYEVRRMINNALVSAAFCCTPMARLQAAYQAKILAADARTLVLSLPPAIVIIRSHRPIKIVIITRTAAARTAAGKNHGGWPTTTTAILVLVLPPTAGIRYLFLPDEKTAI